MLESGKERWKINPKYLPVLFLCPKSFNTHSLSYASRPAVEKTDGELSVTQYVNPEPGLRLGLWIPYPVPFPLWQHVHPYH